MIHIKFLEKYLINSPRSKITNQNWRAEFYTEQKKALITN